MARSITCRQWLRFQLQTPSRLFYLLFTPVLLGIAGWQAVEGFQYNSNDTTNLWLRISHTSAAVLLVILAVIWLPVLNHLLSRLRRSRWARYQPLDQRQLHRLLGYGLLLFTLAHGSGQLFYLNTLSIGFSDALLGRESDLLRSMRSTMYEFVSDDESIDVMAHWIANGRTESEFQQHIRPILKEDCTKCHSTSSTQTYAIPTLPLSSWQDAVALSHSGIKSRQFRINISGLLLFSFFILIGLLALPPVRKRLYHRFQQLHRLGYWMLPLLILHIPQWQWLLPAILLLAWDGWLQWRNRWSVQDASVTRLDRQTLQLQLPGNHNASVGDYLQVRIPAIDSREWHPFSIAHSDSNGLQLKINISGDWTLRLARYADLCPLYIDIQGPYPSPATASTHSKSRVMIAGGIGITPYWPWLEKDTGNSTLVWVIRDGDRLEWLRPRLDKPGSTKLEIYLTDPQAVIPSWAEERPGLVIHTGRPCWETLAESLSTTGPGDCYLCGPPSLMREAGRSFRKQRWHLFRESF